MPFLDNIYRTSTSLYPASLLIHFGRKNLITVRNLKTDLHIHCHEGITLPYVMKLFTHYLVPQ